MAPPAPVAAPPAPAWRRIAAVLIPLAVTALVLWVNTRWLLADRSLPTGDAGGHCMSTVRFYDWLRGISKVPLGQYPPLGHLSGALGMMALGRTLFAVQLGVASWLGVMALGCSLLGLRTQGLMAALVTPILVCSIPSVTDIGRRVLLDTPAAAWVPWILLALWETRYFKRLWPSLALGFAVAAGVMVKYTFILWLLPALALVGLITLVRAPVAVLPLGVAMLPGAWALSRIWARRPPRGVRPTIGITAPWDTAQMEWILLGATAALVVAALFLARWRTRRGLAEPGGPRDVSGGLLRGLHLGAGVALAFALTLPWFYASAPLFLHKLLDEAVDHRRVAGLFQARHFAAFLLWTSWFRSFETSIVAGVLSALTVLAVATGVWRRRIVQVLTGDLGHLRAGDVAVQAAGLALSAGAGLLLHAQILPTDTRYYFYIPVLMGLLTAIGACWLRVGRLTLAPALLALGLAQLLWTPDWNNPAFPAKIIEIDTRQGHFNSLDTEAMVKLYVPRKPDAKDLRGAVDELWDALEERLPEGWAVRPTCMSIGMAANRTREVESDSVTGYLTVKGLNDCMLFPAERLLPNARKTSIGPSERDLQIAKDLMRFVINLDLFEADQTAFQAAYEAALGRPLVPVTAIPVGQYGFWLYDVQAGRPDTNPFPVP